jgi:hypothetical protein
MDLLVADTAVEDERRDVLMLKEDGTYTNNEGNPAISISDENSKPRT